MQISVLMLIFLLFLDHFSWGGNVQGGASPAPSNCGRGSVIRVSYLVYGWFCIDGRLQYESKPRRSSLYRSLSKFI